jgi:16S rRNA (cytosine1402-N4)-methyltransferase
MHKPVLVKEVIELLIRRSSGVYVDCTIGSGGHTDSILEHLDGNGMVIGIDKDADAIERARIRLLKWKGRVILVHEDFRNITKIMKQIGVKQVDGILMDLGMSSEQIEDISRGFSFMGEGPLDMRMDRRSDVTAEMLVNELSERELADLLFRYGEERHSRRIARAIVMERAKRRILTTTELANIVGRAVRGRRGRLHPATRTFMALRIAVNDELGALQEGLQKGIELLRPGGRIGVISFHSLEDRIVKQFFNRHAECGDLKQAVLRLITRKPVQPTEEEKKSNPRARSAKLRVAERIEKDGGDDEQIQQMQK